MLQVLSPSYPKKDFGKSLSRSLSQHLPDALETYLQKQRLDKEDTALEKQQINLRGIKDPKIRSSLLEQHQEKQKNEREELKSQDTLKSVEDFFGSEFARLWEVSPTGGKTELLKAGLDAKLRGDDLSKILSPYIEQLSELDLREQQFKENFSSKSKTIDFDKGLNPSERVSREEKRYDKNLGLYQESQKRLLSLENEADTINILNELNESKKLPSGAGRWNVSIKEGNLHVPTLANAETQKYIKTVNEFLNKAKDTFGSRVTNFELDRFLQRLPTLANSEEGRRDILSQMKYFNTIQVLYEQELQNVIDEHGGVRKIDFDRAERIAKERINPKVQQYKKEFKEADTRLEQTYQQKIEEYRARVPEENTLVEKQGKIGYIPKKNLYKAEKAGYKRL